MKKSNEDIENKVKGNIAEDIVEAILKKEDFEVYRTGYETILSDLCENREINKFLFGKKFTSIPDFIVIDKHNKEEIHFLEIKYRKDGILKEEEKDKLRSWIDQENLHRLKIIIISNNYPYVRCASVEDYINRNEAYPIEKDWRLFSKRHAERKMSKESKQLMIDLVEKYLVGPNKK